MEREVEDGGGEEVEAGRTVGEERPISRGRKERTTEVRQGWVK